MPGKKGTKSWDGDGRVIEGAGRVGILSLAVREDGTATIVERKSREKQWNMGQRKAGTRTRS